MKTLPDFNFKNKRVLVRCDFNVPLSGQGEILDDFRIKQTIPTIEYLIKKEAKVILMSHLGRPEGKVVEGLRLTPIQEKLMEYLDLSVTKAPDCVGKEVEEWVREMEPGEILLLENLRFHQEEEEGEENFTKNLAKLGDIFINEAFSVCHRSQASVVGITKYLPSGAGFLLEKEIEILSQIIKNPERPLIVIIGGSKVKDKAKVIGKFLEIGDWILVGNLVAKEIREKEMTMKNLEKIIFPVLNGQILDLDKKTIENFKEKIKMAKTIFWAGPLGKIEEKKYQKGTREIARAIIKSRAFSVVGGGDTIEFLNKAKVIEKFNHISTGGSALLEFLAEEKLPGIEALEKWQK